jgi:hypothetical protein
VLWCGYDNKGNLFVDGLPPSGNARAGMRPNSSGFQLAELRKGSKKFINLTLKGIAFPGNIQWDGSAITVGDPAYKTGSAIDRLRVSGSTAKIVGRTVLRESYEVYGSWIQGNTAIGPDDGPSIDTVGLWKYPAGGKPKETLSKGSSHFFNGPFGAAVSLAK